LDNERCRHGSPLNDLHIHTDAHHQPFFYGILTDSGPVFATPHTSDGHHICCEVGGAVQTYTAALRCGASCNSTRRIHSLLTGAGVRFVVEYDGIGKRLDAVNVNSITIHVAYSMYFHPMSWLLLTVIRQTTSLMPPRYPRHHHNQDIVACLWTVTLSDQSS